MSQRCDLMTFLGKDHKKKNYTNGKGWHTGGLLGFGKVLSCIFGGDLKAFEEET